MWIVGSPATDKQQESHGIPFHESKDAEINESVGPGDRVIRDVLGNLLFYSIFHLLHRTPHCGKFCL